MSDGPVDVPQVPQPVRAACGILVLEGLALTAAAAFLVWGSVFDNPDSIGRSLLGAVMAAAGALALFAGSRSLLLLRTGARSPMIVLQVLALPVSYSLAIQAGKVLWGGPIMIAALAVLYLLFTPPAREALDRQPVD